MKMIMKPVIATAGTAMPTSSSHAAEHLHRADRDPDLLRVAPAREVRRDLLLPPDLRDPDGDEHDPEDRGEDGAERAHVAATLMRRRPRRVRPDGLPGAPPPVSCRRACPTRSRSQSSAAATARRSRCRPTSRSTSSNPWRCGRGGPSARPSSRRSSTWRSARPTSTSCCRTRALRPCMSRRRSPGTPRSPSRRRGAGCMSCARSRSPRTSLEARSVVAEIRMAGVVGAVNDGRRMQQTRELLLERVREAVGRRRMVSISLVHVDHAEPGSRLHLGPGPRHGRRPAAGRRGR